MKLLKIFNKLPHRDWLRFQSLLSASSFNQRTDVKQLLSVVIAEKGRSFPPAIYWAKAFPNKAFSITAFNLVTSRLFKLLEDYLIQEEMKKEASLKKFYLAKAYRRLQEEKLFKGAVRDTARALDKQPFQNMDYLQRKHDLSFQQFDYILSSNRKEKTNLKEVNEHLDAYFIAAKLRHACYGLSRQVVKQEEFVIGLLDEAMNQVATKPALLDIPAIAIYYHCYNAIQNIADDDSFHLLRKSLHIHQHLFPAHEIRDLFNLSINLAIQKLNLGSKGFALEAFELYVSSLEQGYLLEDGILLESAYGNIISLACKLKRYSWAHDFAKRYQAFLKKEYQKPLYYFSLGKLYYEEGRLEDSRKQLVLVETKTSFLFLGARILQLKIYYELKEFNLLESLLESLRVYLQRSKDLAYRKKHYENILHFTRQLFQLKAMSKRERLAFRQRLEEAEIFAEREWFLQQVDLE